MVAKGKKISAERLPVLVLVISPAKPPVGCLKKMEKDSSKLKNTLNNEVGELV